MCDAQQSCDQMICGRCGLAWDVGDPERPACAPKVDRGAIASRAVTNEAMARDTAVPGVSEPLVGRRRGDRIASAAGLPAVLPDHLAQKMGNAYETDFWRLRQAGRSWEQAKLAAMATAYRALLASL